MRNNKFRIDVVAPREGCVSRNFGEDIDGQKVLVAPREGCVSRNLLGNISEPLAICCTP